MQPLKKYLIYGFILMYCTLSVFNPAKAQDLVSVKALDGRLSQVQKDSSVALEIDSLFNAADRLRIDTPYAVKNMITVKINEASDAFIKSRFSGTVLLKIIYTNAASEVDSLEKDFVINYDPANTYKSISSFAFSGAHRVEVHVLNVGSDVSWDIAPLLMIENEMAVRPEYQFLCSEDTIQSIHFNLPSEADADELQVSWSGKIVANEYDLEWTYIDKSALDKNKYGNPANASVFENNATRVTLTGTSYAIPLIYDNEGALFFRVRPVQAKQNNIRVEGNWSSDYIASGGLGRYDFQGHERKLNWQSSTSFAEEGKRKILIQYYDGSLRSRQTVTKDNTTGKAIVSESYYDYQGRPVIQVLPSPSLSNIVKYSADFNQGINGTEYHKSAYDYMDALSGLSREGAAPMSTTSGAAQYYSPANPEKEDAFNSLIPDARGYVFTETEYTRDNTGRISRQSGVGYNHRLGSDHETQYFYGGFPDQNELDALFGTNVGSNKHYFKNMVRDANGQYSVSYTDMHGRTIATALAGTPPDSIKLQTLNSNLVSSITETLSDLRRCCAERSCNGNQKKPACSQGRYV